MRFKNVVVKNIYFFNDTLFMNSKSKIYVAAVPNMPPENKIYEIDELKMKVIDVGA